MRQTLCLSMFLHFALGSLRDLGEALGGLGGALAGLRGALGSFGLPWDSPGGAWVALGRFESSFYRNREANEQKLEKGHYFFENHQNTFTFIVFFGTAHEPKFSEIELLLRVFDNPRRIYAFSYAAP